MKQELSLLGVGKMRMCLRGLMLVMGSVALADEADKSLVEVSASDSTTWRLCLQDPSEWKMPGRLSEAKRASWIATQQEAIKAQVKIEAEAAKHPTRELQLKSGSVPKDIEEKMMVMKYQKQKTDDRSEVLKLRMQESKDKLKKKMDELDIIQERLKAKIRQMQPPPQQA